MQLVLLGWVRGKELAVLRPSERRALLGLR